MQDVGKAALVLKACRICGTPMLREDPRMRLFLCSTECRDLHASNTKKRILNSPARKKHRRIYKARRRAAIYDGPCERIDALAVFERDAWTCYLCGCPTPAAKRGSTEPDAPELEHKLSLADGGLHTWANVACACRKCNGKKGSSSSGVNLSTFDPAQAKVYNLITSAQVSEGAVLKAEVLRNSRKNKKNRQK